MYYKTGILPYDQRFVFAGRLLELNRTFSDYDIKKESSIYMVVRLRGGFLKYD